LGAQKGSTVCDNAAGSNNWNARATLQQLEDLSSPLTAVLRERADVHPSLLRKDDAVIVGRTGDGRDSRSTQSLAQRLTVTGQLFSSLCQTEALATAAPEQRQAKT
jgi:hypothetical protein